MSRGVPLPTTPLRARDVVLFVGAALLVVLGTTSVPYLFASSQPVKGASTALGFNNQVAYAWYVAAVIVAGLLLARVLRNAAPAEAPSLGRGWLAFSRPLLSGLIAAHVVFFAGLFAYKGRFVFSEGIYFQALLHRMEQGEIPYVDFSYWYGPSMLYPAHWLSGLIGLEAGYAVWYVLTYSIGLLFLFVAVSAFVGAGRRSAVLSVLFAVVLFNPMTGLNFTFTRYLLPTMVFLVSAEAMRAGGRGRWTLAAGLLAFAVLHSLETAALSVFAVLALVALTLGGGPVSSVLGRLAVLLDGARSPEVRRLTARPVGARWAAATRGLSLLLAAGAALLLAFIAIDPSLRALAAYPDAATADLAGAHNLPVYPNLPFLALAAGTVFAIGGALRAVTSQAAGEVPVVAAYLPLALIAQRPSFSVSDQQHFLFFGLATLLICLHLATGFKASRRAFAVVVPVLLVGLALPHQAYQATQLLPFVRGVLPGSQIRVEADAASVQRAPAVEATITQIARRVGTERPYLMYGLTYYSVPVYHRLGLRYASYHTDISWSVATSELVGAVIQELREKTAVVVIDRAQLEAGGRSGRADPLSTTLAWLMSAPLPASELQLAILRSDAELHAPFFEFLRNECRPIIELNGLVACEAAR